MQVQVPVPHSGQYQCQYQSYIAQPYRIETLDILSLVPQGIYNSCLVVSVVSCRMKLSIMSCIVVPCRRRPYSVASCSRLVSCRFVSCIMTSCRMGVGPIMQCINIQGRRDDNASHRIPAWDHPRLAIRSAWYNAECYIYDNDDKIQPRSPEDFEQDASWDRDRLAPRMISIQAARAHPQLSSCQTQIGKIRGGRTIINTFTAGRWRKKNATRERQSHEAKPTIEFSHEITLASQLKVRGTAHNTIFTNMMTEYNLAGLKILSKMLIETGIAFQHVWSHFEKRVLIRNFSRCQTHIGKLKGGSAMITTFNARRWRKKNAT